MIVFIVDRHGVCRWSRGNNANFFTRYVLVYLVFMEIRLSLIVKRKII